MTERAEMGMHIRAGSRVLSETVDRSTSAAAWSKLAIEGGPSLRIKPFAAWPYLQADDIESSVAVLRSGKLNYWTGDEGRLFEKEYAEYTGTKHAIAVANGTVGLELALYALGIGLGDEVVTSSRTFIASASCVVMCRAKPVMADVDPESQNITAAAIRRVITPRTKAIVAVHLAGWPCDMDAILQLASEHNLKVVEDCAQAHGARYKGRPVGSMGHINSFSFCQDKIMTTAGEGGMVTTNDDELWERAWSFKDHGKSYRAVYGRRHPPGFRWLHESFGTNWRLTEMQSAMGRLLLRKIDGQVGKRQQFARMMNSAFARIPVLRTSVPPDDIHHSYYKYYVFVRPERLLQGWSRDRVMNAIIAEGIPCFSGSCSEIYLEKAFDHIRPEHRLPVARELGETSLMFLVHPTLSEADIRDTIAAVQKVAEHASGNPEVG
jgi:dTDP-4-amino-4,6-dideoxygalactose transaminase